MSNEIITILAGILILALIIVAIFIRFKTNPSIYDKEMAEKFLQDLSNVFYDKIMEIINNINFLDYSSLEELEVDILKQIYDTIWEFVEKELKEAAEKDILTALALKVLDKNYIDKFIDKIVEESKVSEKLSTNWSLYIERKNEVIEEEDKNLQEEFSNNEEYNADFDVKDLPPAEQSEPTDEDLAGLNPPSEEDPVYDDNDDSVEPIEDESYTIDSNGRKHDKNTGKFI